jgi:hypothetical protein
MALEYLFRDSCTFAEARGLPPGGWILPNEVEAQKMLDENVAGSAAATTVLTHDREDYLWTKTPSTTTAGFMKSISLGGNQDPLWANVNRSQNCKVIYFRELTATDARQTK